MKVQEIIKAVQDYLPDADFDAIQQAYAFARKHHQGQTRASGEPYITHVAEVAFLATKLKLDVPSIVTSLLHDVVEDTEVTLDEIQGEFGKDVRKLVDGVTKLSQVKFSSRAEEQSENFRKMLLAMAQDIRVLLIKLCDRLHNMRTLEFLSESRRARIAQETLDIYSPLAHRLGIYWMKSELEDLTLRYLKPSVYENIKKHVSKTKRERSKYIEEVVRQIQKELEQNGISGEVAGRPKHFFSIYHKMESQGLHFNEIYDLIAFRIIVGNQMECYAALGVIHAAWKPIPGRFKDYVAMPKPNQYQSLHTTVIGPQGARIEIQIRTKEMHELAERGVAAHWVYKELRAGDAHKTGTLAPEFSWLRDLIESEKALEDPHEFMSSVKDDLFPQEVYVFTPKGDLFALAQGATPIDFAYHVHSEIGHRCTGARVNGQQVALAYRLQNGDTVEITTSEKQHPSKDWLKLVTTTKAKQRIRSWLRAEERTQSISVGKQLLGKDLRKVRLNYNKLLKNGSLAKVAESFGFRDPELLLAEIGYGKINSASIVAKLLPDDSKVEEKLQRQDTPLQRIFQRAAKVLHDRSAIKVNGMEDVVFRFAKCCQPLPGDELVGYVTRGRGVTIHTRSCAQTLSFDPRRLVPVSWDDSVRTVRSVHLKVHTLDRIGVLAQLTQAISGTGANIVAAHIAADADGKAVGKFEIKVESSTQLASIRRALENVDGVIRLERDMSRGASSESEEEGESAVE